MKYFTDLLLSNEISLHGIKVTFDTKEDIVNIQWNVIYFLIINNNRSSEIKSRNHQLVTYIHTAG